MINIPEKYAPLNTEEKITALFEELKSKGCTYSAELEIAILYKVRKVKLQIFLKDLLQQLPKKNYSTRTESTAKKEFTSVQNLPVSFPTKKVKSCHHESNNKKELEKILRKRVRQKAKMKQEECQSSSTKTYPRFIIKEDVDAYIRGGHITSIQEARNLLKQASCMPIDTGLYVYLRKRLYELIEKIKLSHCYGTYQKMHRQQELDKEMANRGPIAKIIYIPSGGQNKRY